ncbi:C6 zinc finger domain-containing protein [Fusarium heterosporum]|uniref:C6 zinc finger domain-containing protein n=1 Tax=Fusarium heterosporum TaxID=42747 RepID=A0A8H5TE06_FUSHE|nr:C6 zinc finger domain-containing protein [Fusarium heterosporum]
MSKPTQDLVKSLHQKVMSLESSMQDISAQLARLQPQRGSVQREEEQQVVSPKTYINERVLIDEVEPADQHIHSAPAEVMRRVASQVSGDLRRAFYTKEDVVSIGMLSATVADSLVRSFIQRRRHVLFINNESDLVTRGTLIQTSPFLHAVCCTHEMRYTHTSQADALKHREVYEHTRGMLGQVMLGSPLHLEEITGVLINALFAGSPSCEAEYTSPDKCWNLDDNRSSINENLGQCLPGTPPTTMRDTMLLAEISLYCTLQQDTRGIPTFASDGSCEKFKIWNQKWGYLLELPTGLVLNLSYYIANVILAKRSLDHIEALALNRTTSVSPQASRTPTDIPTKDLQDHIYELSFRVILAFVAIPNSSSGDLPEFHSLCVAYSMLILCQYDELPPSIPRDELSAALHEVKRRCNESNAYSVAVRFSVERAWERLRMDSASLEVESVEQSTQFGSHPDPSLNTNTTKVAQNSMSGCQAGADGGQLDNIDYFFNGGYLDILDIDNFLL